MRYLFSALLVCLTLTGAWAQTGTGHNKSVTHKGNIVDFVNTRGDVRLEFVSPSAFRVRASWDHHFEADEHLMQQNYQWPAVQITMTDTKGTTIIKTSQLIISIVKSPFVISVSDSKGHLLSSEYLPGGKSNGGIHHKGDTVSCTKDLMPDEHFFGFGERMDLVDQRGQRLNLKVARGNDKNFLLGAYNVLEANYCPVPFFMSTKGYGIFLHNAHTTQWDMGQTDYRSYTFKADGGEMDYYFIYGPDFPAVLNSYTAITGKSPMLPRFAFGLHMGTYSGGTWGHEDLTSDTYVINLARKMRQMGIPVDILFLDSTWRLFGKVSGKGATSYEWRETFKNPKGMFDSLYAMHYKMVGLHIRSRLDNANKLNLLDEARAKHMTYPENDNPGEFLNFFDQNAVNWWWDNAAMRVAGIGAKFFKTDEGSAFGSLANESDKVGPTGKVVEGLHNVFPLAYAKAPFLKFQQLNGIRGMNQTREGYAGIQRYPYIFAGDWPSEWQYFAPVIKAGINIGLSGVSDWAHCMGGFEHVADPELYIRWTQFGFFSPISMVFGMDHPGYKEPWAYGDEALANFKKYDLLRYRLVPYIYSNAYQAYKTGLPLMRALVLTNQDDPNTYQIADQYMFGDALMVCPVTVKGAQTRTVYLPAGDWTNYWTGQQYHGKQYMHILTPLNQLPIFVKAGSVIPMQPEMIYMDQKPVDVITLDIYPGKGTSAFELYEDDGLSLDYQRGVSAITRITTAIGTGFNISVSRPAGNYHPQRHHYKMVLHWPGGKPAAVTENGTPLNWDYNEQMQTVSFSPAGNNSADINISIR